MQPSYVNRGGSVIRMSHEYLLLLADQLGYVPRYDPRCYSQFSRQCDVTCVRHTYTMPFCELQDCLWAVLRLMTNVISACRTGLMLSSSTSELASED